MNALFLTALLALASPAPAATPAVTVHIANFAFVPATVTVRAGTTVAFVNDDSDAHTVTAVDRSFDSGGLDSGESWSHVFASPGTFAYVCALHPVMRATVVVTK